MLNAWRLLHLIEYPPLRDWWRFLQLISISTCMSNLSWDHSIKEQDDNITVLFDHSTDFQPQKHRSGYVKPRPAVPEPIVDEDGFTSVVKTPWLSKSLESWNQLSLVVHAIYLQGFINIPGGSFGISTISSRITYTTVPDFSTWT